MEDIIISDMVGCIKKYVRKTRICGGRVDDVVDNKKELTQYLLETFKDGDLIFVCADGNIYEVRSKQVIMSKAESLKMNEQIEKEREEFRKRIQKNKEIER